MSSKTHRWKSFESMKLVNSRNFPQKKTQSEKCLINILFEKSPYFTGTNIPYKFIFTHAINPPLKSKKNSGKFVQNDSSQSLCILSDHGIHSEPLKNPKRKSEPKNFLNKTLSLKTVDTSVIQNLHRISHKLYSTEYVVADSVDKLDNLNNKDIRCYCISPKEKETNIIVEELQNIKNKLPEGKWSTFRLIIITQSIDYVSSVLRDTMSEEEETEEEEKDEEEKKDEEEEENILQYLPISNLSQQSSYTSQQSSLRKFRDSRYIQSNFQVNKLSENIAKENKLSEALKKIAKAFDNGINHAKKASQDLKVDIDEIIHDVNKIV